MSTHVDLRPSFALTPEQEEAFTSYGPLECIKATVAARILSGDPSALTPTAEQIAFVLRLAQAMGVAYGGAVRFFDRSTDTKTFKRGMDAYTNPGFYRPTWEGDPRPGGRDRAGVIG